MFKILTKVQNWFAKYKNYFKALEQLQRMDDRQLADIGISRCDIPRIAESSFRSRF